jgi:hypothetical protein
MGIHLEKSAHIDTSQKPEMHTFLQTLKKQ